MDHEIKRLTDNVNDIKGLIQTFNDTLANIESRLARLEKVDSIEHRIAVNQIDLSDIKESLERIEEVQQKETQLLKSRLDSHLIKIAKAEEEILMLKNR